MPEQSTTPISGRVAKRTGSLSGRPLGPASRQAFGSAVMQATEPPDEDEDEDRRRRTNLVLLAVTVLIVILGIWLVNKFMEMRNIQNCLNSGRRNCTQISAPQG